MRSDPTPSTRFSWLRVIAGTVVIGTAWLLLELLLRPGTPLTGTDHFLAFVLAWCMEYLRWDRARQCARRTTGQATRAAAVDPVLEAPEPAE